MIYAGIDAGSRAVKVVLIEGDTSHIAGSGVEPQGVKQEEQAQALLEKTLAAHKLRRADVKKIIATGYGRNLLTFADSTVTEITCHARGVRHLSPDARTIIDIGGQDSKLVRLAPDGSVRDFTMNDRCAAGTGCFLEVAAARLGITLDKLSEFARRSSKPAEISSMCVVFAETEIVGLLAGGAAPEDIVAGIQSAIARRVASMAGRALEPPAIFTGGVAMIPGMTAALEGTLGVKLVQSPQPQFTGALGAALIAKNI